MRLGFHGLNVETPCSERPSPVRENSYSFCFCCMARYAVVRMIEFHIFHDAQDVSVHLFPIACPDVVECVELLHICICVYARVFIVNFLLFEKFQHYVFSFGVPPDPASGSPCRLIVERTFISHSESMSTRYLVACLQLTLLLNISF